MKKVQIPKANTPTEYLTVRLQLVHVKKGLLGLRDKEVLTALSVIPDTPKDAVNLTNQFAAFTRKYGVALNAKGERV